jgi:uncharacterized protein
MSWLVDGNALLALAIRSHPHHLPSKRWFESLKEIFCTCSVTEGTFLRLHMRLALDESSSLAWSTLKQIQADSMHRFIDDGFSYAELATKSIIGQRQVTDAWLAQLARKHQLKLATFDVGLVRSHPDVGILIT